MVFSEICQNTAAARKEITIMVDLMKLILVMLLLFLSFEVRMHQTEATDTCQVQSAYFIGFCLIDHHCDMVCKIEGFPSGKCLGLAPHCICQGTCQQPSPPSPAPVAPAPAPAVTQYSQPPSPPVYSQYSTPAADLQ